jgi:tetratricopeptide (TPR) repeat protein
VTAALAPIVPCPSCGQKNRIHQPARMAAAVCAVCGAALRKRRRWVRPALCALVLVVASAALAFRTSPDAWNKKGVELAEAGHHQEAIQAFTRAVRADEHLSKAHYNMGLSYWDLGQPDQALICFQKALDADPGNVDASAMLTRASRVVASRHR